ncbi:MAG: hypothetical protein HQ580_12365 [Planctomycetes bacterium]|nr:hypothetical protein [Planctomycetota bacterium]
MDAQLELTTEEPTAVEEVFSSDDTILTAEEQAMENDLLGITTPEDTPPEDKVISEETVPTETPPDEPAVEEVPPGDTVPAEDKPVDTPIEDKPAEDTAQKLLEEKTKQYDELHTLHGQHTHELGQLRQQVAEISPLLNALNNDPVLRNKIYAIARGESPDNRIPEPEINMDGYDPGDPESVKTFVANMVKSGVKSELQQQNQEQEAINRRNAMANMTRTFQANSQVTKDGLIAQGRTDGEITEAQNIYMKDFLSGKFPEMAYNHVHLQEMLAAARKEGSEETVGKLNTAKKGAKTLAAASTSTPSKDTEMDDLDGMTEDQINKLSNDLPVDHPTSLKIQEGFRSGRFNRFGL